MTFAAIDFETANAAPSSVCSVGVVVVRDGAVAGRYYSLIRPEPEFYTFHNTRVHGITEYDTAMSPIFPAVWGEIAPLVEGLELYAHNAQFDKNCLKAAHRAFGMEYPDYTFRCSCVLARKKLKGVLVKCGLAEVSAHLGIPLVHHHNALDDAEACAGIVLALMQIPDTPAAAPQGRRIKN